MDRSDRGVHQAARAAAGVKEVASGVCRENRPVLLVTRHSPLIRHLVLKCGMVDNPYQSPREAGESSHWHPRPLELTWRRILAIPVLTLAVTTLVGAVLAQFVENSMLFGFLVVAVGAGLAAVLTRVLARSQP